MVNKIRNLSYEFMVNEQWRSMPPKCRKCYRDNLNKARRKERRILNRMVEELVVEELGDDLAYWSAELDKALDEHGRIVDEYTEDERIFERFGDVPDWDYYETRFAELRKRIDIANRECYTAA